MNLSVNPALLNNNKFKLVKNISIVPAGFVYLSGKKKNINPGGTKS